MAHGTPLRLLIIGHSGQQGGAEFCLDILLQHLSRERFVTSLLFACDGPMVSAARDKGYATDVVTFSWWLGYENSFWYWRNLLLAPLRIAKLNQRLKAHGIDLVYTNSAVVFEGAIAAKRAGVPHVWHIHEILTPRFWKSWLSLKTVCRLIDRWSDALVFESNAAKQTFESTLACGPPPALAPRYVVPNPLRLPVCPADHAKKQRSRAVLGLDEAQFVILWVGQFIDRKNPHLMLRAFSQAQFTGRATLLMLGDGPLRASIDRKITHLNSEQKLVLVPGFRQDVSTYMEAADVLVLTSKEESFGMVLIEAAAAGLPCIATRCGGPEEIIDHGVNGFLVSPNDDRAVAERLQELEKNPALRSALGRAAQHKAQYEYSPHRYTQILEGILMKVAQQNRYHER